MCSVCITDHWKIHLKREIRKSTLRPSTQKCRFIYVTLLWEWCDRLELMWIRGILESLNKSVIQRRRRRSTGCLRSRDLFSSVWLLVHQFLSLCDIVALIRERAAGLTAQEVENGHNDRQDGDKEATKQRTMREQQLKRKRSRVKHLTTESCVEIQGKNLPLM